MPSPASASETIPIDYHLLDGFSFACRPDCGLCCYARPLVMGAERQRLLQIEPLAPLHEERAEVWSIASRPSGGACHFLTDCRCRVHAARPFPCAQFPIDTHLGTRIQLTLVFSCPGLPLDRLASWTGANPASKGPIGLDSELAAVEREFDLTGAAEGVLEASRQRERLRRRLDREGRWEEEIDVHTALRQEIPTLIRGELPVVEPPPRTDGLENLPLFFHPKYGRVALASSPEGWELLGLAETGGEPTDLGVFPVPTAIPRMTTEGERLLRGYLSYLLERDHFWWELLLELSSGETGSLLELARESLGEAAADVLYRGSLRAKLDGATGETLSVGEVADGIRTTDADRLDRPTLGSRL